MNHSQDGTAATLLRRLLLVPPPPEASTGDPLRVLREGCPARTAGAGVAAHIHQNEATSTFRLRGTH
ncbi:hypothetical protein, partial [Streptomyces sp. NPDC048551]|uniref:hypothetical protein n=1 Tax=Streptomyces sp. NPDC048551 TaxID=3155758 RepID=UPI00341488AE